MPPSSTATPAQPDQVRQLIARSSRGIASAASRLALIDEYFDGRVEAELASLPESTPPRALLLATRRPAGRLR
jgi:hypothetical protein